MKQTFTVQTDMGNESFNKDVYKDITNWEVRDGVLLLYKVGSTFGINLRNIIDWKAVRQP